MADPRPLADPYSKERIAAVTRAEEEPFYSPSLAAAITARMGPGFAHAYRPDRKRFLQTPFEVSTHGQFIHPDAPAEALEAVRWPYGVDEEGDPYYSDMVPKRDHVYNFGKEPSAQVFAHEFRHRAGVMDERKNRLYDAMYSQTPEDWSSAAHMFRDYEIARNYSRGVPLDEALKMTEESAERELLRLLDHNLTRNEMLGKEYDAAPEWDKPVLHEEPSIGGFIMDLIRSDRANWIRRTELPYQKLQRERKAK